MLEEGLAQFASLGGIHPMLEAARREPLTLYAAGGMGNVGSPHRLSLIADPEAAAPR